MKNGLIYYKEIEELHPAEVVSYINKGTRLNYGSLTISELQIVKELDINITENWPRMIFGYGVYIMFDGNSPVYIGKANSNFLHRFSSHQSFDGREHYGFNMLARKAAEVKMQDRSAALNKELFSTKVIPMVKTFDLIRINCLGSRVNSNQCGLLEKIVMKAYETSGVTLYNSIPRNIAKYDPSKTIKQLMA